MFGKLHKMFTRMNLDKKLRLFTFLSIGLTTLTILFASTFSYINLMANTSLSLIESQLQNMSDSLSNTFSSYKDIAVAVTLDDSVQQYLLYDGTKDSTHYFALQERARQSIANIRNTNTNMNFIAVVKQELSQYIYNGTTALTTSQFCERFNADMLGSHSAGSGVMRINFGSVYYNHDPYSISIYHPIFNTSYIGVENGMLSLSMREPVLKLILEPNKNALNYQLLLINEEGTIVSCSDIDRIGQTESFFANLMHSEGRFNQDRQAYIFTKLDNWDFYVVAEIQKSELYKDGMPTIFMLIIAIALLVAVSLYLCSRILNRSYQSMKDIVYCMEQVSDGNFHTRMDENTSGNDFVKIARGFNHMTQQVEHLMKVVKEEQHQIEQIKFNALQSQIKPHFLYNVLDCIHWQAAMEGSQKIPHIVKSLAEYYRLCLSGGRDIIELSEEIRHVKSYITIQNVRYGDIVSLKTEIEPMLQSIQIPKMTLQPLVENSIYHGIKIKEGKKGEIRISAHREGEIGIITVQDNGNGMSQSDIDAMNASISVHDENFGYGVRNVHKRIELLFGKQYGLCYRQCVGEGLMVEIRLPLQTKAYK